MSQALNEEFQKDASSEVSEDHIVKEAFLVRVEWWEAIQKLDTEAKAQILENLFYYHKGERECVNLNNLPVSLVWSLIEPCLRRNIKSYDRRCETSRKNGLSGGRPPKNGEKKPNVNLKNLSKPNETLSDSDSNVLLGKEPKEEEDKEERIDFAFFSSIWNSSLPGHTKLSALTDKRRKAIKSRLPEFGKTKEEQQEVFQAIIERIKASPFLGGDNDRGWKPDFDWLFKNSDNWRKVYEGKFDQKAAKPAATASTANTVTLPNKKTVILGVGEYIHERGHRTLGSGINEIPMDAPPRPSTQHYWSRESNTWNFNGLM